MSELLAARLQMGVSLGFHIVFACIGMTMPWLMAAAEWRYMRTGEPVFRTLAQAWAKGVAVLFAVGAVSGTVLSFELGLLWPEFMRHAGPIIGLPFSWEGTAFFLEAIALGLYLYGWRWLSPRVHLAAGILVGITGVASGILVVSANAWMNSPTGFRWVEGQALDVDPVAAMFNDAWLDMALHMTLAAFASTGLAVAGVHALKLRREPHAALHRHALRLSLTMGSIAAIFQPLSGDLCARRVAERQPAKLAAMEALYDTQRGAPLLLGGVPDDEALEVRHGIEVPYGLSVMLYHDPNAEVTGLDRIDEDERPNTLVCHLAFQIMVAAGILMVLLSGWFWWLRLRRPAQLTSPWFLRAVVWATPLGFIAVEAGWTVTEVGRQPWIIQDVMRTEEALTSMPGLGWSLAMILFVYAVLILVVVAVMVRLSRLPDVAGVSSHG